MIEVKYEPPLYCHSRTVLIQSGNVRYLYTGYLHCIFFTNHSHFLSLESKGVIYCFIAVLPKLHATREEHFIKIKILFCVEFSGR